MKNFSYQNLKRAFANQNAKFAKKADLGTLAGKNEITVDDLAAALKALIDGKAEKGTKLADYGITDAMTQEEIATAIAAGVAGAEHLTRVKVNSVEDIDVEAEGAAEHIYMVPKTDGSEEDHYDEYMVIDKKVERVGDWKIDLSDYATIEHVTQAISTALESYMTSEEVTQAISAATEGHIKLTDLDTEVTGAGNVVTNVSYDKTTGKTTVTKGIVAMQESDFVEYTDAEIDEMTGDLETEE